MSKGHQARCTPWSLAEESGQIGVALGQGNLLKRSTGAGHLELNADGEAGTLCCWALLNLSTFEPAQVRCSLCVSNLESSVASFTNIQLRFAH
jgi:hypothetical protein